MSQRQSKRANKIFDECPCFKENQALTNYFKMNSANFGQNIKQKKCEFHNGWLSQDCTDYLEIETWKCNENLFHKPQICSGDDVRNEETSNMERRGC